MSDKCKKLTSTLALCEEMELAISHELLHRQTLRNRAAKTSRERVVLRGKAGDMPLWYCPFCRINIAIPAASPQAKEGGRDGTHKTVRSAKARHSQPLQALRLVQAHGDPSADQQR